MVMKEEAEFIDRIEAIVLDLDFTIIGFRGGFQKLLDDLAFTNVNPVILIRALDYANHIGFTIDLFIKTIEAFQDEVLNRKTRSEIRDKFNCWLRSSLHIFDDAREFLETWKDKMPMSILTFGCPSYQQKKIKMLGLEELPVYFSSRACSKAKKLGAIFREYRHVAYVDDNINEINEIAKYNTTKRISLFWLNRNSELKGNIQEMPDYIQISSLLSLNRYLISLKLAERRGRTEGT